jgi:hypothetical protein
MIAAHKTKKKIMSKIKATLQGEDWKNLSVKQ